MKHPVSVALVLALFACAGGDLPSPPPPPFFPPDVTIGIVSGNGQQGAPGAILAEPFAVRVINPRGEGVPGVEVSWAVTLGGGDFWLGVSQPLPSAVTHTDVDGVARVYFRPAMPGASTVSASTGPVGLYAPVTFAIESGAVAVVVIRFGPNFDCYGTPSQYDPSVFDSVGTVPLGTRVEWEYAVWLPAVCTARVVTQTTPPGGQSFDSGILQPGQRFAFVPRVAGEWVFVDSINGGRGTLTVR